MPSLCDCAVCTSRNSRFASAAVSAKPWPPAPKVAQQLATAVIVVEEPVAPPPKTVSVRMPLRTAEVLNLITGWVGGSPDGVRGLIDDLGRALDKAGVEKAAGVTKTRDGALFLEGAR